MFYFHVSADGIPPPAEHLNPAPDAVSSTDPSQANSGRPISSSTWGFSRTPPGSPVSPPSVTSEHRPHPDSASPGSSQPAASSPSESRQGGMCLLSVIMSSQFLVPT